MKYKYTRKQLVNACDMGDMTFEELQDMLLATKPECKKSSKEKGLTVETCCPLCKGKGTIEVETTLFTPTPSTNIEPLKKGCFSEYTLYEKIQEIIDYINTIQK